MRAHIMLNIRRAVSCPHLVRNFAHQGSGPSSTGAAASKPAPPPPSVTGDVPGLSAKVVKQSSGPVGPGASVTGDYKVPEYFQYNKTSYFEAEIEMSNFRCPQPNANRKQ